MEQPFELTDRIDGGRPVVAVSGELDIATAPLLRQRIQALFAAGQTTILVDLLGTTFIDSTGLGVLVGALKESQAAGGDLILVVNDPRILKLFDITGLIDVFTFQDASGPVPDLADE